MFSSDHFSLTCTSSYGGLEVLRWFLSRSWVWTPLLILSAYNYVKQAALLTFYQLIWPHVMSVVRNCEFWLRKKGPTCSPFFFSNASFVPSCSFHFFRSAVFELHAPFQFRFSPFFISLYFSLVTISFYALRPFTTLQISSTNIWD